MGVLRTAPRTFPAPAFVLFCVALFSGGSFACAPHPAVVPGNTMLGTGMTWTVIDQRSGLVHVGADANTDAYSGDTGANQSLPLLCMYVDGRLPPARMTFDFYNGWSHAALQATAPIQAATLTTRGRADAICAERFGSGYRMAEFHDGRHGTRLEDAGGWSYWGHGTLTPGTRMWVAINDQRSNAWNSAGGARPSRKVMTWTVIEQREPLIHVGSDSQTNPYLGDTGVDQSRSLLCIKVDGRRPPEDMSFDFYRGWSGAVLQATAPVYGARLTSRDRADAICAQTFGPGYRMAEFHDGRFGDRLASTGGWSYWGNGVLSPGTRVWIAINDQPANPWNSAGDPLPSN